MSGYWVGVSAFLLAIPSAYKLAATAFSISFSHHHIQMKEIWKWRQKRIFFFNKWFLFDKKENLFKNPLSGDFLSHLISQNQWKEPSKDQSLGLQRNYNKRLKLILIPALKVHCLLLNSWIKFCFLSKEEIGQGWLR